MSRLVFITGGTRSGKSDYALKVAEEAGGELVYIATATAGDEEMARRIEKHRTGRGGKWRTVEEPLRLTEAVESVGGSGCSLVIDCLTLWLTNLLGEEGDWFEDAARESTVALAEALRKFQGTVAVVSNEVGMGIVPGDAVSRRFRDAAGAANRIMADAADEVYLVVSGIPVKIK